MIPLWYQFYFLHLAYIYIVYNAQTEFDFYRTFVMWCVESVSKIKVKRAWFGRGLRPPQSISHHLRNKGLLVQYATCILCWREHWTLYNTSEIVILWWGHYFLPRVLLSTISGQGRTIAIIARLSAGHQECIIFRAGPGARLAVVRYSLSTCAY
jgi:hypothetical protein